jgi:hypothetical protein
MLWFYCLILLFFRQISFLISLDPEFKLALLVTLALFRIIQSCPFLPMIDLLFGLAYVREYFLHPPLLECPHINSGSYKFIFCHVKDWCEADIHWIFQPFTELIGKSFVRISAGLSFPGTVLIRSFSVRICWRR